MSHYSDVHLDEEADLLKDKLRQAKRLLEEEDRRLSALKAARKLIAENGGDGKP